MSDFRPAEYMDAARAHMAEFGFDEIDEQDVADMACIMADEASRLAAEAAREARYQPTGFVGWHDGKAKTLALFSDEPDMPQHIAGAIAYGD